MKESSTEFLVGSAKADITPDCIGVGMLGWGDESHKVKGVKTPIYARAVAIKQSTQRFYFVCAELCFITEALRQGVMEALAKRYPQLAIKPEELLLSATHTHNTPGGHSKYFLYNITIPGFQPRVLETYVNGVVKAIVDADSKTEPAHIRLGSGSFAVDSKVAFNRSLKSWGRNPEAKSAPVGAEINRLMVLLRFDSIASKKPLACVNWFPVHCTSIHRDCPLIHSDNKGLAAMLLERELASQGYGDFIAVFAQGAAGDVTPNFVKHFLQLDMRGPYRDDEKNCEFNARLQFEQAKTVYENAALTPVLGGPIAGVLKNRDFSHIEIDRRFAPDHPGAHTGPAAIGCNFMLGTKEGHGTPAPVVFLIALFARIARYARYFGIRLRGRGRKIPPPWRPDPVHGPKICFMESGRAQILGVSRLVELVLPSWIHPIIRNIKMLYLENKEGKRPFTPQVLPLQLVRLGSIVFAAVPAEFTTVSGKRLVQTVLSELAPMGIERVILCGYSNAYAGYVTTREEYMVQAYEGASTHFGMWTLAGYQTAFIEVCAQLKEFLR